MIKSVSYPLRHTQTQDIGYIMSKVWSACIRFYCIGNWNFP